MAIPKTEELYLPFLQVLREHGQLALREVREELALRFHLTSESMQNSPWSALQLAQPWLR